MLKMFNYFMFYKLSKDLNIPDSFKHSFTNYNNNNPYYLHPGLRSDRSQHVTIDIRLTEEEQRSIGLTI